LPKHPRSAAGLSNQGRTLYLLVIDGRRPGSQGATEVETAFILKRLGAEWGLNFDGGGSSALAMRYADGRVRTLNKPIHSGIPNRERAVAACLGLAIEK
jgi:exopolysaccharide biosynthesis protein